MRILGIIPARGGSKGVPGKNKRLLNGKPLIQYSIEAGLGAPDLTKLVVSTDDQEIADISAALGAEVPGLRPAHLATDASPSIDTVVYLLKYYRDRGEVYDAICLLQPTSPMRSADDVTAAINKFVSHHTDSLISVIPVPHEYNPHWVFEPTANGHTLRIATGETNIIPRRQELPPAFIRNGAIYLTLSEVILQQHSFFGHLVGHLEMPTRRHVNIDSLDDWAKAERLMNSVSS